MGPAGVTFGGVAATNVIVDGPNQMSATLPQRASYGTVAVAVQVLGGAASIANGFTYVVPRGSGLQLAGQIGGAVSAVAVQGRYAYIGEGSGLTVVSVANPATPAVVGRIPLPAVPADIAVSGSFAYVADDEGGLQIIDVTNPAAPSVRGFYDTPSPAVNLALGGRAYVVVGNGGLQIIDVSNPAAPMLVGTFDTAGSANDVTIVASPNGVFAYVADGGGRAPSH
jgi:hypothetical protein